MSASSSLSPAWATFVADAVAARKTNSRQRRRQKSQVRPLDELVTLLRARFCQPPRSSQQQHQRKGLFNVCQGSGCLLATPVADVIAFLRNHPLSNTPGCITTWLPRLERAWQAYRTRLWRHPVVNTHWFRGHDEYEPDPEPGTQLYQKQGPSYARRVFNTVRIGTLDTDAMWETAELEQCDLPDSLLQFQTACQTSHNRREVVTQADTVRDHHNDAKEQQRAQAEVDASLDEAVHYLTAEEHRIRTEWKQAQQEYAQRVEEAKACEPCPRETLTLAYIEPKIKQLDALKRDPLTWETSLTNHASVWKDEMIKFIDALGAAILKTTGTNYGGITADMDKVVADFHLSLFNAHAFVLPADTSPDVTARLCAIYRCLCAETIYGLLQKHIQPRLVLCIGRLGTTPAPVLYQKLTTLKQTCESWMRALEPMIRSEPREFTTYKSQVQQAFEQELHTEMRKLLNECVDVHKDDNVKDKRSAVRRILDNARDQYHNRAHVWTRDSLLRQLVSQGRLDVGLGQKSLIPDQRDSDGELLTVSRVMEGFTGDLEICQQHWRVWVQECESQRPTIPRALINKHHYYLDWYVDEKTWRAYQPILEHDFRRIWDAPTTTQLDHVVLAPLEKRTSRTSGIPTLLTLAETHFQLVELELKSSSS